MKFSFSKVIVSANVLQLQQAYGKCLGYNKFKLGQQYSNVHIIILVRKEYTG